MSPLTSHVLDTARGRPARGLALTVDRLGHGGWERAAAGTTNDDGRCPGLLPPGGLTAGTWRVVFQTGAWFESQGQTGFYPHVEIVFRVDTPTEHYHIPLLLSPFGYSTYRGS